MNVEKNRVMRISSEPTPLQIMVDKKQLKNVECFNCLSSIITNGTFGPQVV